MAQITFRIDDSKATAKLRLLESALANPRPVYETLGRTLKTRVQLGFKLGVSPWGRKWQAIKFRAPRTGASGRPSKVGRQQIAANAGGKAGQPLVDTGALLRSITHRVDPDGVTVGTNQLPRAAVHQFGATITPSKAKRLVFPGPTGRLIFARRVVIPARPYLPIRRPGGDVALPPAWALDVIRALRKYLQTAVKAGG